MLGRPGESYTIGAPVDAAQARRVIRSHLRPWLLWSLAPAAVDRREGVVFGFVLGAFVHARPVPADLPRVLFVRSLVVNGRIVPRTGGCEVSLRVHKPWLAALIPRAVAILGTALSVTLFLATGVLFYLLIAGVFATIGAFNLRVTRAQRTIEPGERVLLRRWLDEIERDLTHAGI